MIPEHFHEIYTSEGQLVGYEDNSPDEYGYVKRFDSSMKVIGYARGAGDMTYLYDMRLAHVGFIRDEHDAVREYDRLGTQIGYQLRGPQRRTLQSSAPAANEFGFSAQEMPPLPEEKPAASHRSSASEDPEDDAPADKGEKKSWWKRLKATKKPQAESRAASANANDEVDPEEALESEPMPKPSARHAKQRPQAAAESDMAMEPNAALMPDPVQALQPAAGAPFTAYQNTPAYQSAPPVQPPPAPVAEPAAPSARKTRWYGRRPDELEADAEPSATSFRDGQAPLNRAAQEPAPPIAPAPPAVPERLKSVAPSAPADLDLAAAQDVDMDPAYSADQPLPTPAPAAPPPPRTVQPNRPAWWTPSKPSAPAADADQELPRMARASALVRPTYASRAAANERQPAPPPAPVVPPEPPAMPVASVPPPQSIPVIPAIPARPTPALPVEERWQPVRDERPSHSWSRTDGADADADAAGAKIPNLDADDDADSPVFRPGMATPGGDATPDAIRELLANSYVDAAGSDSDTNNSWMPADTPAIPSYSQPAAPPPVSPFASGSRAHSAPAPMDPEPTNDAPASQSASGGYLLGSSMSRAERSLDQNADSPPQGIETGYTKNMRPRVGKVMFSKGGLKTRGNDAAGASAPADEPSPEPDDRTKMWNGPSRYAADRDAGASSYARDRDERLPEPDPRGEAQAMPSRFAADADMPRNARSYSQDQDLNNDYDIDDDDVSIDDLDAKEPWYLRAAAKLKSAKNLAGVGSVILSNLTGKSIANGGAARPTKKAVPRKSRYADDPQDEQPRQFGKPEYVDMGPDESDDAPAGMPEWQSRLASYAAPQVKNLPKQALAAIVTAAQAPLMMNWVAATVCGALVFALVKVFFMPFAGLPAWSYGALFGLCMSVAQSYVLRRFYSASWMWVAINVLGAAGASALLAPKEGFWLQAAGGAAPFGTAMVWTWCLGMAQWLSLRTGSTGAHRWWIAVPIAAFIGWLGHNILGGGASGLAMYGFLSSIVLGVALTGMVNEDGKSPPLQPSSVVIQLPNYAGWLALGVAVIRILSSYDKLSALITAASTALSADIVGKTSMAGALLIAVFLARAGTSIAVTLCAWQHLSLRSKEAWEWLEGTLVAAIAVEVVAAIAAPYVGTNVTIGGDFLSVVGVLINCATLIVLDVARGRIIDLRDRGNTRPTTLTVLTCATLAVAAASVFIPAMLQVWRAVNVQVTSMANPTGGGEISLLQVPVIVSALRVVMAILGGLSVIRLPSFQAAALKRAAGGATLVAVAAALPLVPLWDLPISTASWLTPVGLCGVGLVSIYILNTRLFPKESSDSRSQGSSLRQSAPLRLSPRLIVAGVALALVLGAVSVAKYVNITLVSEATLNGWSDKATELRTAFEDKYQHLDTAALLASGSEKAGVAKDWVMAQVDSAQKAASPPKGTPAAKSKPTVAPVVQPGGGK